MADYEPLPRYNHISGRVGSLAVVQGGRTEDFSEESKQHLSSVVEIFDPYSESWEQRQVEGTAPLPGTCRAASASLHDDLFTFGGTDEDRVFFNTIHRLNTKTLCWSKVCTQNADGAPMAMSSCRMIAFRNSLVVFGGYGIPQGPTEPRSFMNFSRATDGRGWTNELHIYNLTEGNIQKKQHVCSSCLHHIPHTVLKAMHTTCTVYIQHTLSGVCSVQKRQYCFVSSIQPVPLPHQYSNHTCGVP